MAGTTSLRGMQVCELCQDLLMFLRSFRRNSTFASGSTHLITSPQSFFSVTKSTTTSTSSISMCCLALPCASTHFPPRCLHPCFIDLLLLLLPSQQPPAAIPIGEAETAFPLLSSCATSAASVSALSTRTAIGIDDPWVESVILNRGSTNTIGKV